MGKKLTGIFRIRKSRIWVSRGIFVRIEKRIWRRRQRISRTQKDKIGGKRQWRNLCKI